MTTQEEINPAEFRCEDTPLNLRPDPLAPERVKLQAKYGFTATISSEWDDIAREVTDEFGGEEVGGIAGVNHIDAERNQVFVGVAGYDIRGMNCFQGACSTLITRKPIKGRTALAFNDLLDFPLFASNDMHTKFEKRTYIGALILPPENIGIGTVWWVGNEPREWRQHHLDFMKSRATKVMGRLQERLGQ